MGCDAYLDVVWPVVPRLVSLLDRDPTSPTYGCFDRTWWSWKFTDMPAPRMQEAVLCLALLADVQHPRNPLAGAPQVWRWVDAGIRFLAGLQHRDGSFDEAYPFERSWGGTAFLAAAVAHTLDVAGDRVEPDTRALAHDLLGRAGRWLASHDEDHGYLANHRAAGVDALCAIGEQLGDGALLEAGRRLGASLIAVTSPEGWLPEYDGADPGYQSHALDHLARAARHLDPPWPWLDRLVGFLALFLGHDGGFAGEVGSRDTAFLFPGGVEELAARCDAAAALAPALRDAVGARRVTGLEAMDDRNLLPMLASHLVAARHARPLPPRPLPRDIPATRWLPEAGLLIQTTVRYHAIVAARKGGVVVATGREGRVFVDSGWASRTLSTAIPTTGPIAGPGAEGILDLTARLQGRRHAVLDPWRFSAFRATSVVAAVAPPVSGAIKRVLVRALVSGRRVARGQLRRRLHFDAEGLTIEDTLWDAPEDVMPVERVSAIHMGSARYFQARELLQPAPCEVVLGRTAGRRTRRVRVRFPALEGEDV